MLTYAKPTDLTGEGWVDTGKVSDVIALRLLRRATLLVARATGRTLYRTSLDADAIPLRDATCAQAAEWINTGNPVATGAQSAATGSPKRTQLLTGEVEYDTAGVAERAADAADRLGSEAEAILYAAVLLKVPMPLYDTTGELDDWGLDGPGPYRPQTIVVAAEPTQPSAVVVPRKVYDDDVVAPGEVVWVIASNGQAITLLILHEPAGGHCSVKRYDQSNGTVTLVPESGLIDGQPSHTLGPMDAFDLDSDGTDFAIL